MGGLYHRIFYLCGILFSMHTFLSKLSLVNFKSYSDAVLEFSPRINCFVGDNGVGKTNVMDAIYYLSMCKSYFAGSDIHHIKHGNEFFVVQGEYHKSDQTDSVYCGVKNGSKKIFKRNSKEYDRLSDHIGYLPIVVVSPSDSILITEGSEERRKFIDSVISQYNREYLDNIMRYNRALMQRNMLLKDFDQKNWFDQDMVDMWDDQLFKLGTAIFEQRKAFISDLIPVFQRYYEFVSGGNEQVELVYESQLEAASLDVLLKESMQKDRAVLFTTQGIHKDDLALRLGDYSIKRIGSQGQQKTFLVALKLAQFEFIKKCSGLHPILLLDDIFDKFDSHRVDKIINLVADEDFGQIFITDTSSERMHEILKKINTDYKLFGIDRNEINVEIRS